ncbi:MAG TPA: hypothetical protein VGN90_03240 [Pyrinomonadaceae bacterium]|nr:hypothetical protein [Pyrinomonadaceae bacterium]
MLLCLDGVPYDLMLGLQGRGLFDKFNSPSRLLSPFPTMTNIALSTMLGGSTPLGYETIYFDREVREIRGGVGKYLGRRTPDKLPSTYMDQLDYQEPLPFEFLVYVAPETVWRADMNRFRDRFRAAPQNRDYFAFLKGTDGLLHIRGIDRLEVALLSLEKLLREIHEWCGTETEIVLFSDHGMSVMPQRRIPLKEQLQLRGFEFVKKLSGPSANEVVLPAFGLIGFAAFNCAAGVEADLAEALASIEGIDFALYKENAMVVNVKGAKGLARIHRREQAGNLEYGYEKVSGDPLDLNQVSGEMAAENLISADGFAPARIWADRTATHIYPNALNNLYGAIQTTRVLHPADVLVSLCDGYYIGWRAFEYVVKLAATHGNAMRASSTAFLMSTHRAFGNYVTAHQAESIFKA